MGQPKPKYGNYARKIRTGNGFNGYHGLNLTADEIEFGRAIEKYKREHHRPWPTFAEVLQVAKSLGYEKVGE